MTNTESAPIAPISGFVFTHAHKGVIPAVGAMGANRRSEHHMQSQLAVTPRTDEQNDAYRNGLCIDCKTVRYSAGRPRCNDCHGDYMNTPEGIAP